MPKRKPKPKPIAVLAYAKHRKQLGLPGGTHRAVQKAIEDGRLTDSVVTVLVRGKETAKIVDAVLADEEWAQNTRDPDAPPETVVTLSCDVVDGEVEGIAFNEARRRKEIELWRQARVKRQSDELDLAKRRGELVSVQDARAEVVERYTATKTKLLGLAVRIKQRLPQVKADDAVMIDELVREALEDLADGK